MAKIKYISVSGYMLNKTRVGRSEKYFIIPPATKLGGGGYTGITLSVRLSVRLSVDARLGKMVSRA